MALVALIVGLHILGCYLYSSGTLTILQDSGSTCCSTLLKIAYSLQFIYSSLTSCNGSGHGPKELFPLKLQRGCSRSCVVNCKARGPGWQRSVAVGVVVFLNTVVWYL